MALHEKIILKADSRTYLNKPLGTISLRKIWFTDEGWGLLKKSLGFPDKLLGQFNGKSTTIDFIAIGAAFKTADFDPEKDEPMKLSIVFKA